MPRRRLSQGNWEIFHVTNRSVRRVPIFCDDRDHRAFQKVIAAALERVPTRLIAFCVMPNHWHLIISPIADELPRFMHRLTIMHSKRWHLARRVVGTGPLYQGPYRARPVSADEALLRVIRYVESNPVRAGLKPSLTWSSTSNPVSFTHSSHSEVRRERRPQSRARRGRRVRQVRR